MSNSSTYKLIAAANELNSHINQFIISTTWIDC